MPRPCRKPAARQNLKVVVVVIAAPLRRTAKIIKINRVMMIVVHHVLHAILL